MRVIERIGAAGLACGLCVGMLALPAAAETLTWR